MMRARCSLPNGRTEVKVVMSHERRWSSLAWKSQGFLGKTPPSRNEVQRFKQMMETGGPSDEIKQRSI